MTIQMSHRKISSRPKTDLRRRRRARMYALRHARMTRAIGVSAILAGVAAPAVIAEAAPRPSAHKSALVRPRSLCPNNLWAYDLKTGVQLGSLLPGSKITSANATLSQAVVQLDYHPTKRIRCTQANIVVEYQGLPSGWTVDIGDSSTNDGYGGGTPGTTLACAEAQVTSAALLSTVQAYRDCVPPVAPDTTSPPAGPLPLVPIPLLSLTPLSLRDGALKFVVRDRFLSVGQPYATTAPVPSKFPHSFHIPDNGFSGSGVLPDGYKIYAAFNRVINGTYRSGTGARRVMITLQ